MLRYYPNSVLFVLFILFITFILFAWDRDLDLFSSVITWFVEVSTTFKQQWMADFFSRVSGLSAFMLIALVFVLVFALLQVIGAAADVGPAQGKKASFFGKLQGWISGRSWGLYKEMSANEDVRNGHFEYGREALLAPLRLAQLAFPIVGFIGTVIGVSGAVKNLPSALEDETALDAVLANLHTAFDTTFIGLAASVFVMIAMYLLDSVWDRNDWASSNVKNVQVVVHGQ